MRGGDDHGGVRIRLFDLTVDPLQHGFIPAAFRLEDLDKLLGADVVGQRPQPLAGAAGQ